MWAATGPFSGCHISVGLRNGTDVYVAHIAKPGDNAENQWQAKGPNYNEVARFKVGLDKQKNYYHSSIVFVEWFNRALPNEIQIIRMECKTQNMGAFDPGGMLVEEVKQIPLIRADSWQ